MTNQEALKMLLNKNGLTHDVQEYFDAYADLRRRNDFFKRETNVCIGEKTIRIIENSIIRNMPILIDKKSGGSKDEDRNWWYCCPNCNDEHAKLQDDYKYCPYCGKALKWK